MDDHPDVPMLLLGRENNCGLPQARNLGIARARAAKVMILDADNAVYPTCLRRLADALDADPDASFAYATLEAFGAEPGLRSHLPWHVPWLCAANYLDAQAMIRRDVLAAPRWLPRRRRVDLRLGGLGPVAAPRRRRRARRAPPRDARSLPHPTHVDDLDEQPRRRRDPRPPRRALPDPPVAR